MTNARGYQVFTADDTSRILENIGQARGVIEVAVNRPGDMPRPFPTYAGGRGGNEQTFRIEYSPTIYINGDKPDDLEKKLRENNENLLAMFEEFLRKRRDDEGRMAYA